jgi:hypothetical protein
MLRAILIEAPGTADDARAWSLYINRLGQIGYLSRNPAWVTWDPGSARVIACAELAREGAWEDSQKRKDLRDGLPASADKLMISTYPLAFTEHDHDCPHSSWDALALRGDEFHRVSPLMHEGCHGIVARYVLGLPDALADALWYWTLQYDHVYSLWLASDIYEDWALQELTDPQSPLNRAADELVKNLEAALGTSVRYEVMRVARAQD